MAPRLDADFLQTPIDDRKCEDRASIVPQSSRTDSRSLLSPGPDVKVTGFGVRATNVQQPCSKLVTDR